MSLCVQNSAARTLTASTLSLPQAANDDNAPLTFEWAVESGIIAPWETCQYVPMHAYGNDPYAKSVYNRPFHGSRHKWASGEEPVFLRGGRFQRTRGYGYAGTPKYWQGVLLFQKWAQLKRLTIVDNEQLKSAANLFCKMSKSRAGGWGDFSERRICEGRLGCDHEVLISGKWHNLYKACNFDSERTAQRKASIQELFGALTKIRKLP